MLVSIEVEERPQKILLWVDDLIVSTYCPHAMTHALADAYLVAAVVQQVSHVLRSPVVTTIFLNGALYDPSNPEGSAPPR